MTPDNAARKALEEAHEHLEVGGLPLSKFPEAHAAINRLARAAWEAGLIYHGWDTNEPPEEPSWLPPNEDE